MKANKTRKKVKETSQISQGNISETDIGKLGSNPQINSRIDKEMVLDLSAKREALTESQHESLRARSAILDTLSFEELTRMLCNFSHGMLWAWQPSG